MLKFLFKKKCPTRVLNTLSDAPRWKNREIPIVLVQMDQELGFTCLPGVKNVVPISAKAYYKGGFSRIQLPIIPAHASTIHSAQGLTAEFGVVLQPSAGTPFAYGLEYVGCSRAKSMDQIHILINHLKTTHFSYAYPTSLRNIREEYVRLENTVGIK